MELSLSRSGLIAVLIADQTVEASALLICVSLNMECLTVAAFGVFQ